ncbi:methyltransferase domain-containing protein [Novipirellula artificiosorum]|uniref:Methyltransferase domain-containing protein n=1 Tax=Novipirellula artificiosorum TaxID=2528016 RepID=A0A5C6D371_9BACT|nr:methyltransferase domain-containing protein [Novipirellula artificiosorum]TWU31382.1 hypothetical protein Poly41_62510 [Novipirellula artificiosorum]
MMSSTFPRNRQPELMDQDDLPQASHQHALNGLARLNGLSGIAGVIYRRIRQLAIENKQTTLRVLDIASGSADLPIAWALRAKKDGLRLDLSTLEISSVAIEEQLKRAKRAGVTISPIQQDCLSEALPTDFEVITNSLFLHHLDDPNAIQLVRAMHAAAKERVMICDLERTRLNLALVSVGARLVTRSKVVHTDSALSVQGAYTINEFHAIVEQAVGFRIKVARVFPCRFLAMLPAAQE